MAFLRWARAGDRQERPSSYCQDQMNGWRRPSLPRITSPLHRHLEAFSCLLLYLERSGAGTSAEGERHTPGLVGASSCFCAVGAWLRVSVRECGAAIRLQTIEEHAPLPPVCIAAAAAAAASALRNERARWLLPLSSLFPDESSERVVTAAEPEPAGPSAGLESLSDTDELLVCSGVT